MRWLKSAAILATCLSATSALAATITLSGDRGFGTVEVRDADLYLADETFRVLVEQARQGANNGVIVRRSPSGATWEGGSIVGMGINRTETWDTIYNQLSGNGACLIIKASLSMTVARLRCDWAWDGFRPEGQELDGWRLRLAWINNNRDDGIENDKCNDGRIEHSLIENTFVGYSARPGSEGGPCEYHLEVIDSLIHLGKYHEVKEKRFKPWSNIENGVVMQSGALWKVTGRGSGTTVLLRGNIIKLDHTPGVSVTELPIVPEGWQIQEGSGDNTLVWLGANDLPGLTYEMIDGCKVPKEFKVPTNLFRVACGADGEQIWNAARARFISEIEPADPTVEFLGELTDQMESQIEMIEQFLKQRSEPEG